MSKKSSTNPFRTPTANAACPTEKGRPGFHRARMSIYARRLRRQVTQGEVIVPDNHGVSRPPAQDVTFQDRAQAPNRLKCSTCGIEVDAGCDCGAPHVPAAKRVADTTRPIPANRHGGGGRSGHQQQDRQQSRQAVTEVTPGATVTGRDGKNYPAKKSKTKEEVEIIERDRKACIALYGRLRTPNANRRSGSRITPGILRSG